MDDEDLTIKERENFLAQDHRLAVAEKQLVATSRDASDSTLSNQAQKETRMPNANLKRKGRWIQSFGLLIILADAVFGFLMFRGDLGHRHLESVLFPILIAAVVTFAGFMVWGGTVVRRSEVQDEPTA